MIHFLLFVKQVNQIRIFSNLDIQYQYPIKKTLEKGIFQILNYKSQQTINIYYKMNKNRVLKNPTTFFFEQAENIPNPYAEQISAFSKSLLNFQKCQLCKHKYDMKMRKPRIMIHCGHTFCTACLLKFYMNRRVRCPTCLKLVKQIDSIQRLPLNHTIITHMMNKKNQLQGKAKPSFLDDPSRLLFAQFQRVQKQAHMRLNPPKIDADSNLPFCVFHPQRIQHFYCCGHQIAGCRVCTEIGHAKQSCKVIDLYQIKNPVSLINSTFSNKKSSKEYMSFGLDDDQSQIDENQDAQQKNMKSWLDSQIP